MRLVERNQLIVPGEDSIPVPVLEPRGHVQLHGHIQFPILEPHNFTIICWSVMCIGHTPGLEQQAISYTLEVITISMLKAQGEKSQENVSACDGWLWTGQTHYRFSFPIDAEELSHSLQLEPVSAPQDVHPPHQSAGGDTKGQ